MAIQDKIDPVMFAEAILGSKLRDWQKRMLHDLSLRVRKTFGEAVRDAQVYGTGTWRSASERIINPNDIPDAAPTDPHAYRAGAYSGNVIDGTCVDLDKVQRQLKD